MGNFGVLEEPELAEAAKVQIMQGSLRAQALYYTVSCFFFQEHNVDTKRMFII